MSELNRCCQPYCPSTPEWEVVWIELDDDGNEQKSYFCQSCADNLKAQDIINYDSTGGGLVDRWIELTDVDKLQLTLNGLERMESLLKVQLRDAHNLTVAEGSRSRVEGMAWQLNVIRAAQAVALAKFVEMDGPWRLTRDRLR
jgi:hypothetical protein